MAYESGADYIVSFDGAVREAAERLGFGVVDPGEFLDILRLRYET